MSKFVRKRTANDEVALRIVIIDPELCKPNSAAYQYLSRHAKSCTRHCITIYPKTCQISENACPMCVNRAKQAPGGAVRVVRLPRALEGDTTHRYGVNRCVIDAKIDHLDDKKMMMTTMIDGDASSQW